MIQRHYYTPRRPLKIPHAELKTSVMVSVVVGQFKKEKMAFMYTINVIKNRTLQL